MSYGWLTESTLMPKKSKSIKVEDEGSLFSLRAVVLREKERALEGGGSRQIFQVHRRTNKNSGVEERIKRDANNEQEIKMKEGRSLINKQRVYDALESRKHNIGTLLVDFAAKALEYEDEDFKTNREKFYAGKLEEIRQQREEISNEGQGQKDLRERLAWQREMLGTLKGDAEEREKVQQVFDRRLNKEEKEALGAVLRERSEEIEQIEQVKRRRVELQQQRIRKLQRLTNISIQQRQAINHQEDQFKGESGVSSKY